jgi:probable F420-dependent oxidoreductase
LLPTEFPLGFPGSGVVFEAAQVAEQAGFDAVWVGDHILWHCPNLECLSVLSALTGITDTIMLGSAVLLLPLRHPIHVAKSVTTIDQLSGGRLLLGVGVGGENPTEFAATHSSLRDRGRRTNESLRIIRALLRGDRVPEGLGYDSMDELQLEPGVVRPPGPPILVGGRSDAALRRAAELGDGWISLFISPDRFPQLWSQVMNHARTVGRRREDFLAASVVFVLLDDDEERAKSTAERWLTGEFGAVSDRLLRYAAVGSTERVVAELAAYRRVGVEHIILAPMGPDPVGQIEFLGSGVASAL